jgi:sugar/nucleoside kinase (ribokinase family)
MVALTLGSAGVVIASRSEAVQIEVVPATTVDPTGAGDAFCAGFLAEWIATRDFRAAADAGSRLAARAIAVVGGRPPA